jgi:hypothetical protein
MSFRIISPVATAAIPKVQFIRQGIQADIWPGLNLKKPTMSNTTMKTLFNLIFAVFFLMAGTAQAGLQEGIDAYGKGNYPAALKEFRPLAAKGNAAAQSILGFMYANGQGVPQDYNKAEKWYRKAAAQGDADAQTFLGIMYGKGQGVPQDYGKAAEWYRKAAEQGFADAQSNLGMMYANGQGVPQDDKEAAAWYRKAAEQGNAPAQFNLGVMYANGQGVPLDMVEAYKWFSLAEAVVGEEAASNRKLVEAGMTPRQIEEAQKLAREWTEKHK